MPDYSENINLLNSDGDITITLNNEDGSIQLGEHSFGRIIIKDASGNDKLTLNAQGAVSASDNNGNIGLGHSSGNVAIGNRSNPGQLTIFGKGGNSIQMEANNGNRARIIVGDDTAAGLIQMHDLNDVPTAFLRGETATLELGSTIVRGNRNTRGQLIIRETDGRARIEMSGRDKAMHINDHHGRSVFSFDARYAYLKVGNEQNEGDIGVFANSGVRTIHLDGGSGKIKFKNADCAEEFACAPSAIIEEGMVVSLNQNGDIVPANTAYCKKVVGIISGAGDYEPGIILDQKEDNTHRKPVAIMGKVFCMADATKQPIQTGDLLVSANKSGFAMKANDYQQAFGAVIGKALKPLHQGEGLIPVLVTLQ